MSELGKIEKPEAGQFAGKRKLCLVPLVFAGKNAPVDYLEKFSRYWEQVARHIATLESRIGNVTAIYCESIVKGGEEGLKSLESLNAACHRIVAEKCRTGARLEATEDKEIAEETID